MGVDEKDLRAANALAGLARLMLTHAVQVADVRSLGEVVALDEKARSVDIAVCFRQHCELRRLSHETL